MVSGSSEVPEATSDVKMGLADVTQGLQETLGPLEQQLEASQKTPGHLNVIRHQCFAAESRLISTDYSRN